ncbi:uncharacterized protein F5891DRAFT_691895 [Suillus fuscotomentosus]|uniref:Uncharacterized protein n=1 Tax=Suillus fuscotomentosus TaxID=1912939 RepID=A0AAD4EI76_9AGAM|nr:uncharacterized protein F5891DRAFT_691895 [Suillus fuscotomentosus]KAG1905479.1 hypothetical protein F5891DRAFT_691895 [Suillus fuscotomentosus]
MPQPTLKRAPTPVRTAAPFAPHDAMVASQKGHIENLVQKTRNLEHTIKKLNDEFSLEQTRAKDTVNAIKQQWQAEQKEWHVGCDALQACHRIAHLKTAYALDDERIAVLKERAIARRERLARIQRDYKITMFQAREAELESQLEDLQADLDSRVAETESLLKSRDQQYQKTILDLQTRDATLSSELKLKSDEIVAAHKQREDVEDELRRLREAQADADATSVTNVSKLSRITVQRDGLQARVTQLERELEDHKDNNAKLQRQLDNWQGLKKGDDADLEISRKKNVELEAQLREANAVIQERDKALEKEKGRTTKLKEVLHEWKTEAGEQSTLLKQADDEATDAKKAAEKLEQEISDLKAQLTALKTSAAPKSKTTSPPILVASEEEADQPRPKPRPRPKPVKRSKPADSDIEVIEPSAKAKGKRKAHQEDSADEKPAAEKAKHARAKKAPSASNDKAPKKRTLESEAKNQKKAAESLRTKTSKSAAVADSAAEDDQDPAPKKKKRKLNVGIFPSTQQQPPVFHWDQGELGLGIPTELSPVKDAPRRLHPSSTGPSFAKTRG